jgi:hypothetical protein
MSGKKTEPKDDEQDERREQLEQELEDLDVGDDADKVTGGEADPCAGGKLSGR